MLEQNEKFKKGITNALHHLSSNPQILYFTSDIPFLGHWFLNSYQLWNIDFYGRQYSQGAIKPIIGLWGRGILE